MIVRPAPPDHLQWLAERAHLIITPGLCAMEAVDDSGRIVGMVGYDGRTPGACAVHIALEHPAALRHLLKPGFGVPFIEAGLPLIVCMVLGTNRRSLRLVRKLGFKQVLRGKDWWAPGVDIVWFEMRREHCRWIPQQKSKKEAA